MKTQEIYQKMSDKKSKFEYQGKTKKQVQFSEMMVTGSALAMILLILISWIWKLVG